MVKVSIIIPVYNAKKYIKECVDSLRNQTLKEIEIIAVDDGSSDGSYEWLQSTAASDDRLTVLKNTRRKGVGGARNTGYESASGEYIGFVDADDFVDTDFYEKLYRKAAAAKAEVAVGNVLLYYMDTGKKEPFRDPKLYEKYASYDWFSSKKYPQIIQNIGIWDRIYRRDFLDKYQIWNIEDISFEDHYYSVQTSVLSDRICVVHDVFYMYRKNAGLSITDREREDDRLKLDILEQKKICKKFLLKEYIYPVFRESFLIGQFQEILNHLEYTVSFDTFRTIFYEIRNMTSQKDYRCLNKANQRSIRTLSKKVQKGRIYSCFIWCKMRKGMKQWGILRYLLHKVKAKTGMYL